MEDWVFGFVYPTAGNFEACQGVYTTQDGFKLGWSSKAPLQYSGAGPNTVEIKGVGSPTQFPWITVTVTIT
jgi:hypothetical protein